MRCMKKNRENKGFSGIEFLTVGCLCGLFACIILTIAFSTANKEKIKTMRYKAISFKNDAMSYAMITHIEKDTIFLWDLIDQDMLEDISSPFSKTNSCDTNDSYVVLENNEAVVTLKCDDYLIYKTDLSKEKIKIYSVSEWMSSYPTSDDKIDHETLYNYEKDGKEVLDTPSEEQLFLKQFNKNENTTYESIYDIHEDNIRIYGKTYYRTRKAIMELKD